MSRTARRSFSLLVVVAVAVFFVKGSFTGGVSGDEAVAPPEQVVLVILDGTNEEVFSRLLRDGKLPHLAALLAPDGSGERHGIYTPATSVWPSTTGPAYAPFLAGLFPEKSHLSGIRQYLREKKAFRAYIGWQTNTISEDLSQEFPLIYEVVDRADSFSQQGFVTRRGWRDDRSVIRPLHENYISGPGAIARFGFEDIPANDLQNALSFLNYLSPRLDLKRIFEIGRFQGKYFAWGRQGQARLLIEEIFSIAGLERVIRERSFDAWKLGHFPSFSMISLHLPDDTSHVKGMGEIYELALAQADEIIGALGHVFREQGQIDKLTLIISADHGTSPVGTDSDSHLNILDALARDTGVPIHDSMRKMSDRRIERWQAGEHRRWSGIGAVSGNANVQIYMRKPGAPLEDWTARPSYEDLRAYRPSGEGVSSTDPVDLVAALLRYKQVSQVYVGDREKGAYHVFGRSGHSVIRVRERSGGEREYSYAVVSGEDPLGYRAHSGMGALIDEQRFHDGDTWAAATRDTGFPDGVVQIVQLLNGKNSGDLILDAAPSYEPWDQMQKGLHGALRREHILVPLLIYSPRLDVAKAEQLFRKDRLPRTVDVYPTILTLLGKPMPSRIRWEIPKLGGLLGSETREAAVRADIDGQVLDIWKAHREEPRDEAQSLR